MNKKRSVHLSMQLLRRTVGLIVAAAATGCMVHSVDEEPKAPIDLPDAYEDGVAAEIGENRWWLAFNDPQLNTLVDETLTRSLELRQAWARLQQAEAIAQGAGAGLYPTIDAQVGAGYSKSLFPNPLTGDQTAIEQARYSASMPVSYEVDLWGRVRSAVAAAEQDVQATRDDLETVAMTLAANTVEQYFTLVEQNATTDLLERQRTTNETYLKLIELRFQQGQSIASDVYQQRQLIQTVDAQLPLIDARTANARRQLAILTGRSMRDLPASTEISLPAVPPLPATGIPSELLTLRPDLRAARRRVVAADYRVGEAIAARYPSLQLNGSIGLQAQDIGQIFDDFIYSIAGSISQSVFDGGRRAAEVRRTKAVLRERLAAYGLTLQRALVEVEGSIIQERESRRNIAQLSQQVRTAQLALEAAEARYRQGLSEYLVVLTALRSLQQAQQSLLGAQRSVLSNRVQLSRALGGTWSRELEIPEDMRDEDEDEEEENEDEDS